MRTCTICSHKQRKKIEAAIARGESYRHIASQFQVGYKAVERHKSCVVEVLQKTEIKQELSTIATVREVLESLTWDMRADLTNLFDDQGQFDIKDIRERGLGRMLKSLTFKREANGTRVVDIVRVETHSQQEAKKALLNAYTRLEIAKQFTDLEREKSVDTRSIAARMFGKLLDKGKSENEARNTLLALGVDERDIPAIQTA